jgi:hypothetical protein
MLYTAYFLLCLTNPEFLIQIDQHIARRLRATFAALRSINNAGLSVRLSE